MPSHAFAAWFEAHMPISDAHGTILEAHVTIFETRLEPAHDALERRSVVGRQIGRHRVFSRGEWLRPM